MLLGKLMFKCAAYEQHVSVSLCRLACAAGSGSVCALQLVFLWGSIDSICCTREHPPQPIRAPLQTILTGGSADGAVVPRVEA